MSAGATKTCCEGHIPAARVLARQREASPLRVGVCGLGRRGVCSCVGGLADCARTQSEAMITERRRPARARAPAATMGHGRGGLGCDRAIEGDARLLASQNRWWDRGMEAGSRCQACARRHAGCESCRSARGLDSGTLPARGQHVPEGVERTQAARGVSRACATLL